MAQRDPRKASNEDLVWFLIMLPVFAVVATTVALMWVMEVGKQHLVNFCVWAGWMNPPPSPDADVEVPEEFRALVP
jgi:hypothetical protein